MIRACGSCSLCCGLLEIPVLAKPAGTLCRHCELGYGCRIHSLRPAHCHTFNCQWLIDPSLGNHWQPQHAGMFCYFDGSADPMLYRVLVDPSAGKRWRRQPYRRELERVSNAGLSGVQRLFHTVACMGDRVWLIYPGGDTEITGHAYVVCEGKRGWEVETFATLTEAKEFQRGNLASR